MNQKKKNKKLSILNQNWNVINTKKEVPNFVADLYQKGIRQDADYSRYEKYSLAICYIYASCLYKGIDPVNVKIELFRHANSFTDLILDDKEEALNVILEELKEGKPVIAEIKDKTKSHFIIVVGYKEIRSKRKVLETDLLIIDSYDGKIKNVDGKDMYLVKGQEMDKYYDGYLIKRIISNINE